MNIEKIKSANTKYIGKNIVYYPKIESTQEEAKKIVNKNAVNGTIVIADEQTNGKGTKGRSWYSSKGKNITMTIILLPDCNIEALEGITIKIAEAMLNAIYNLYNIKLQIKEPNDLFLNDKKICGILMESKTFDAEVKQLLIGVGFNVNETEFDSETCSIATSLKMEYAKEFYVEDIVVKFIEELERYLGSKKLI